MMNKLLPTGLITVMLSLTACTQVDNYLLGQDNTPTPKTLKPIASKVTLQKKWSVPVGAAQKNSAWLKLKPAVHNNTVYTADAAGVVQAVNSSTGKLLWSRKLSEGLVSGPAVAQGYLIVSTDASRIMVLNQTDGSDVWQASVSGEVLSSPVIAQGKLVAKTIDGNLFAFDLRSGKKLWTSEHGAPSLILKASSSPVVINKQAILVGYSDGKMDAVDLQSGNLLWQRSIAYASGSSDVERLVDIDADPIVQGNTVLLGSYQGYVGALSLDNGQFIWRKPASIYKNMLVNGNTLYLTDSNDILWAINKQTGNVNWKQTALKAHGLTEPVLAGNRLLVGDKTGMLHLISTENGEMVSRLELGSAINIAPNVSGDKIFVMTADGKLSRFSVSNA